MASKNEEAVALEAFDRHTSMVLRRDDFAGWRIDWSDKAANIEALAADLNLGLQSFVFIDDNRHERERVRAALPEVFVPDWPDDPTGYVRALAELSCFDAVSRHRRGLGPHGDVRHRGATLGIANRHSPRSTTGSASCRSSSRLSRSARPTCRGRHSCSNKTNQMNLRTRRLAAPEFLEWAAGDGHTTWCVSVADRLGEAGLTGLVSVAVDGTDAELVDFVLSCRVMGRRVEESMVYLACQMAIRGGASRLVAEYVPTPKNMPCRRFFDGGPFEHEGNTYVVDVPDQVSAPADVTVTLPQ